MIKRPTELDNVEDGRVKFTTGLLLSVDSVVVAECVGGIVSFKVVITVAFAR